MVAPSAAKKKRTSKRVLIEVNISLFLSIKLSGTALGAPFNNWGIPT
jgi:hypothetical protein